MAGVGKGEKAVPAEQKAVPSGEKAVPAGGKAAHLGQAGSLHSALVLVEVQHSVVPGQAAVLQHVPASCLQV